MPQVLNQTDCTAYLANLRKSNSSKRYAEIVLYTMRLHPPLSKSQLQFAAQIRKTTFLKVLKSFMSTGIVVRRGRGIKGDRFTYELAEARESEDQGNVKRKRLFLAM